MKYSHLSDPDLIRKFVETTLARSQAALAGDHRKLMRAIALTRALDEVFRARGRSVQVHLLPYLNHSDEGVRYWSAKRLFIIDPAKARATLEQVADGVGPIAADARGTLRELDSGQFKPETLWAPRTELRG